MRALLLSSVAVCALVASAKVELGHPFSDNMVLQRDMPVRVWGWADPGETVTVSFAGRAVSGTAGSDGAWRVELAPLPACGEPRTLTVSSPQSNSQTISNVLVGEVWFASGQSNMEMGITGETIRYRDVQGRLVTQWTRHDDIRIACNAKGTSKTPLRRLGERARWGALGPGNVSCSALAWYYAIELNAALKVPVGIVVSAWGGSRIEPFIPAAGFAAAGLDAAKEQDPSGKWNLMVNPWAPMSMRGFIWYQGCSNMREKQRYGLMMDALYKGWSGAFENPKLHLNFVQLAPWGDPTIAEMQEIQDRYAKSEPNATMAVVCDNGNIGDIHPSDKETVAKRLVALALRHDYGFDIKAESPGFRAARASGDLVEVSFDDAAYLYDYPDRSRSWCKAFELAGEDGVFKTAEIVNYRPYVNLRGECRMSCGELIGSNVYLRAKGVAAPRKVRYLHAAPWDGQMFNEVGLPLKAFTGDVASAGDKARIEWDVALMEARNATVEKMFSGETSILKYRDRVRAVNGTNVWTDAINAALKEAQVVRIPQSAEPYYVDGTLVVPSNRKILADGATVRLLRPCDTVLMRNAAAADGTLRPIDRAKGDRNIFVLGGRWEDWQTARAGYGRSGRFSGGVREKGKNFYGVSTLLYFGNVKTLTLRGVTIARAGAFAVQCGDVEDVIVEDVEFDRCFADGFHCNGNVRNVLARNVRGDVGDDLVALNFYDWQDSSVNFGPGDTVLCENLRLRSGYPAVRLQPAVYRYADGSKVDCALRNVLLRDVRGVNCFKMYLQTPRYEIGAEHEWGEVGSVENLWFEDVAIDLDYPPDRFDCYLKGDPVRGHFGAFEIGANVKGLHLVNVRANLHAEKYPLAHLVCVGPKSSVRKLKDGRTYEIFDPWVSCKVSDVELRNVTYEGQAPQEDVHATSFDDVNGDGCSTGKGEVSGVRR